MTTRININGVKNRSTRRRRQAKSMAALGAAAAGLTAMAVGNRPAHAAGISYTTPASNYSQNFDNLYTPTVPGNNTTQAATILPTGWSFVESLANANTTFRNDNGSSGTGDTYLDGATGSNERAFGSFASGSLTSIWGAEIVNNTGSTLTQFTLTFDMEQWKDGGSGTSVINTQAFSFGVGATGLTTGTFTNNSGLDAVAKVNNTSADVTLDGNIAANRTAGVTATVTGLTWTNGQSLWIRWSDPNDAGNDDNVAVDNVLFSATSTTPANVTWNTGSGTWDTATGNWTGGVPTANLYKDTDNATFNNTPTGGTVTIQAAGVAPGSTTVNNDASHPYTFQNASGVIGISNGSLTKNGVGTLTLKSQNSYTGGTTLNGGTVIIDGGDNRLGASGAIAFNGGTLKTETSGMTSSRNITVGSSGGTFDSNGLNSSTSGTSTLTAATFTKTGSGELSLGGNITTDTNSKFNVSSGGVLTFAQTSGTINLNSGGTYDGDLAIASAIRVNLNSGTFDGVGNIKTRTTHTSIGNTGATPLQAVISANIVLNANSAAQPFSTNIGATASGTNAPNTMSISGVISGSSNVVFGTGAGGAAAAGGAGVVVLKSANLYSGNTTINNGTLGVVRLGVTNALPTTTHLTFGLASQATGSLDMGGFDQTIRSLSSGVSATPKGITNTGGLSTLTIDGPAGTTTFAGTIGVQVDDITFPRLTGQGDNIKLILAATNAGTMKLTGANTYTGGTDVNGGTIILGSGNILANGGAVNFGGGTIDLNSNSETVGAVSATSGTLASTGGGGSLTGSGTLAKSGGGTFTVDPNATYIGNVSISAGTMAVNGSVSGSVTMSGGTLKGSGAIGGLVSVGNGAHVAPGNSPGFTTYAGGVSFALGSNYDWEHNAGNATGSPGPGAANFDQIKLTGGNVSVTSGAALNLAFAGSTNFSDTFWNSNRVWDIIDNTGGGTMATFATINESGGSNFGPAEGSFSTTAFVDGDGDNLRLVWTAAAAGGNFAISATTSLGVLRNASTATTAPATITNGGASDTYTATPSANFTANPSSALIGAGATGTTYIGLTAGTSATYGTYNGTVTVTPGTGPANVTNVTATVGNATADNASNVRGSFGGALVGVVGSAGSYAGLESRVFNQTGTNGAGMIGSVATILGGTAGGDTTVSMAWRTRNTNEVPGASTSPPFNALDVPHMGLASDVVEITGIHATGNVLLGTGNGGTAVRRREVDPFVLQMTYDPAEIQAINGADDVASALHQLIGLGYLDLGADGLVDTADDRWDLAVNGNFNNFSGTPYTIGAFTDTGTVGLADDVGRWGVDTGNDVVWAVVDHNSQYAAIPEPSSLALVGIGAAGMLGRRSRKRRRRA